MRKINWLMAALWLALGQFAAHAQQWTDVTDVFVNNPAFDTNNSGWTKDGWSGSYGVVNYGCMEFWNGYFTLSQQLTGLPEGNYRLSVQAYYRCGDFANVYQDYLMGNETIPAVLYADAQGGFVSTPLHSIFDVSFQTGWGNDWWTSNRQQYYPNSMFAASQCFAEGHYWNTLEFHAGSNGLATIGIKNEIFASSNWCIFDNFKLEYSGQIVKAQSVTVSAEKTSLLVGETVQLTATVLPANTLQKKVTWLSSNEQVATVDENGLLTALHPGTVTVRATTVDGSNRRGQLKLTVSNNEAAPGSLVINELMASNVDEFVSPAFNFDGWMELYNTSGNAISLTGLTLSNDKGEQWTLPVEVGVLPAGGYKVLWFDSNDIAMQNVPFKLDTDGGTITLTNGSGQVVATVTYPAAMERISYARTEDGGDIWGLTQAPTPGATNATSTFATEQLAAPVVDQPSQLFSGQLIATVTIPPGCTLRYTRDGTLPTMTNGETGRTGQFSVSRTTVYRFRLFANDRLASPVTTRTYIYKDREYYLPVISVAGDNSFLWDSQIGVFAKGPNGRPGNGQDENCNFNMNWERPMNFSFLDADGEMVLNQDVNLEVCGGWSRAWNPRAFKLKGNKELGGNKNLLYPFFTQKPYIRNRTLQIRNGGNDNGCRFKDPALGYLIQTSGIDIDVQSYQPVHEFINGEYIGVLNMREPNNKHYVYANYGWDDDEIDQFEMSPDSGYIQKCGSADSFDQLVTLSADAANSETYSEICSLLNIDAYANYMAAALYLGGTDWPQNNIKGFRHRDNGKYRFVLFDLDFAFNTDDAFNMFMWKENWTFDELRPSGSGIRINDDIHFVTLFRNMLKSADFRRRFIDAYSLMGGSVFESARSSRILDELYNNVQPAMQLNGASAYNSYVEWKSRLGSRLNTATNMLKNYSAFNLSSTAAQRVQLKSDVEGGQLFINGQQVPTGYFNGHLFQPVTLKAVAPAGYAFQGWINSSTTVATTLKAMGTSWQYYDQGSLDNQNWTSPTYAATGWKQGNAPLGYGNPNVAAATTLSWGNNSNSKRPTYYFRTTVSLPQAPVSTDEFALDYVVDDGIVVYVNGAEAARFNMPSGNISYSTYASTYAYNNPERGTLTLPANLFHQGSNVIAVELHNNAGNSTDIIWDAAITAQLANTPDDNFYSTDSELELPNGSVQLTASYRKLTAAELAEQGITPVRVNELSGSNDRYVNEYGKKDDWVELYNTTDEEIDVEGMFLSDDESKPEKYMITKGGTTVNTKIPAHGYLLVWCDKRETTAQALHASFKISGTEGLVMLTAADRSWKDQLTYGEHDGNTTIGRYPDGAAEVYAMDVPTIGKANQLSSYVTEVEQNRQDPTGLHDLIASANGFRIRYGSGQLIVKADESEAAWVEIYTTDGRLVERQSVKVSGGTARLSMLHLPQGFYVARATDDDGNRVACKFIR